MATIIDNILATYYDPSLEGSIGVALSPAEATEILEAVGTRPLRQAIRQNLQWVAERVPTYRCPTPLSVMREIQLALQGVPQ